MNDASEQETFLKTKTDDTIKRVIDSGPAHRVTSSATTCLF